MTTKYLNHQIQTRLEDKLDQLNSKRPLPPEVVTKLKEQFALEMTYNSNAIEGNSLTLKETAWVIQDGLTIKGKPMKDHLEARDHYAALSYLYELIEHDSQQTVSEVLIRTIHQLVVRETQQQTAGSYRTGNVIITGSDHTPPDVSVLPGLMRNLIRWIGSNQKKLHPVELAAIVHHELVSIHPFFDGNGRTARVMMNLLLLQQGYPLVIVLKNDRQKYYQALNKADHGDYSSFVRFTAQAVERSLNVYIKTIAPSSKQSEKDLPLFEIAKTTPYSGEYLNLLARTGKIEAHKEKRNWVTTQSAIERYMKGRERQRK
jgi:Fic family protein